ncbi:hypothetical protein DMUE_0728 [Dictyocoela muelleri]|nr:hypothetical protein DMUE_0728 [Dictyocoela muelleri]
MGHEVLHFSRADFRICLQPSNSRVQSTLNDTVLSSCRHVVGDNRRLFMDNLYNSFALINLVKDQRIYTTGTLRHRRGGPSDLLSLKKRVTKDLPLIFEKNKRSFSYGSTENLLL